MCRKLFVLSDFELNTMAFQILTTAASSRVRLNTKYHVVQWLSSTRILIRCNLSNTLNITSFDDFLINQIQGLKKHKRFCGQFVKRRALSHQWFSTFLIKTKIFRFNSSTSRSNITEKVLQVGDTLQGKSRWMVFKAIDRSTDFVWPCQQHQHSVGDRERLGQLKLTITNM